MMIMKDINPGYGFDYGRENIYLVPERRQPNDALFTLMFNY